MQTLGRCGDRPSAAGAERVETPRRVAAYEAAASAPASLPPHPDQVAPATGDRFVPLSSDATTADKLARVRARLPAARNAESARRDALGVARRVAQVEDAGPLDTNARILVELPRPPRNHSRNADPEEMAAARGPTARAG